MIYLSAQPDETRFIWEIEVQHYNFKQNGIDLKQVYAIFGYKNRPSDELLKLKECNFKCCECGYPWETEKDAYECCAE